MTLAEIEILEQNMYPGMLSKVGFLATSKKLAKYAERIGPFSIRKAFRVQRSDAPCGRSQLLPENKRLSTVRRRLSFGSF